MTDEEIAEYYANLLILQYTGKPKAYATVEAFVTPFIMNQLPIAVQNAFNINSDLGDIVVGVQLDVIGKYVGVSRNSYDFSGPIVLDDADFLTVIKMGIIVNNAGSSLADIQNLLAVYFPGTLLVFDYQNMQMDYFFNSSIGSVQLAEVFIKQGLLPRPMGVELGALIYSANIDNFFGFRTYGIPGQNVHGFNSYTSYETNCPWLSYKNAIAE